MSGASKYYRCQGRSDGTVNCVAGSLNADKAEQFVLEHVRGILKSTKAKKEIRAGLEAEYDRLFAPSTDLEDALRARDAIENEKDRLLKILNDEDAEFFRKQIDALKAKAKKIEQRIALAEAKQKISIDKGVFVQMGMDKLDRYLATIEWNNVNAIRECMRALQVKVEYNPAKKDGKLVIFSIDQEVNSEGEKAVNFGQAVTA